MTDGSHFARECLIAFTPWHLDAVSGSHPPHLLWVDCVEEVRELAIWHRTMRPARGCLIGPKRAGAQASGSALRASGGSGRLRQGGTRLERPTGLLTRGGRGAGSA